jgi:hypothetical protein
MEKQQEWMSFSIGNSEVTHHWNPYEPTIPEYDANNYNGSGQSTMIKGEENFTRTSRMPHQFLVQLFVEIVGGEEVTA